MEPLTMVSAANDDAFAFAQPSENSTTVEEVALAFIARARPTTFKKVIY